MRHVLLIVVALIAATEARGGAWPRGDGNAFLSFKYTGRYDRAAVALLDFTREDLVQAYGEIGLTPRLTFGGELSRAGPEAAPISEARGFLRYTVLKRGAHVASAELGAGRRGNAFGYEATFLRPGLAWGRGYESRFGTGWMELDLQGEIYASGQDPAVKLDATLGLNLTDRFAVILQGRAGDYPNIDPYLRVAPSAVVRLTERVRVQAEIEAGLWSDTGVSGAIALWLEF
jgi:hypothetical protein